MKDYKDYRSDFPLIKDSDTVYFDNAATVQRPQVVIDSIIDFMKKNNANPLRGLYDLSVRATQQYENARHTVAKFLNAKEDAEIVFTRNATEAINLVATSWGENNIKKGDNIVVSIMEHHSNLLPWQRLAKKLGAKLVFLELDENYNISPAEYLTKINSNTKIVALSHVSNVLGITNPVKEIIKKAHEKKALVLLDGAQSTPHIKVDVQDLDADFFAFSGHKLGAPMGIGALYAKRSLLESMPPFLLGGEMIEYVTRESATYAEVPHKFEAGTVNANGAVGLAKAIDYIENEVGFDYIGKHDTFLVELMLEKMSKIPYVNIIGSKEGKKHSGIVTFTVEGVHPHDIAAMLDSEKIAVRAGHHCTQPLMEYLGVQSTARASVWLYNTEKEVEYFIEKLKCIRRWLGYGD